MNADRLPEFRVKPFIAYVYMGKIWSIGENFLQTLFEGVFGLECPTERDKIYDLAYNDWTTFRNLSLSVNLSISSATIIVDWGFLRFK